MTGYAIGIDLGTSNTVVVLRGPDGRSRPLLFDGQPIMPSAVYLDERGHLHVGRDAQRMAQLDPSRFEPNPKRSIDAGGVLLGDREVSTVDMLAALLRVVAATTIETIGYLPPATVTYPASWGPRRRETLGRAVAQAGWPPVTLVPEPVAAARYFVEILRRPVPVGACLAVFDFGGGTLDVAVVRNTGAGFEVLGSGGSEQLGGLDVDAALVERLGEVLEHSVPETWKLLSAPRTTGDRRARRLFWADVCGAKEMLSRATVAPVPVPGVEAALHLTRDELERVATPLLRRAVAETADVIRRCQLDPRQLAGLFLVGGASRIPLAARLLHAELGIAPIVLEQPELPVAEGAVGLGPAEPPTVPTQAAAVSGPPMSGPPMSGPPASGPPALGPPPVPLLRRPVTWILAGAVVAVLALVGTLVLVFGNSYDEVDFVSALPEPKVVAMPAGASTYDKAVEASIVGDRAYLSTVVEQQLWITAWDLGAGKQKWQFAVPWAPEKWFGIVAVPGAVLAWEDASGSTPYVVHALDADDHHELWSLKAGARDRFWYYDTYAIQFDEAQAKLRKLDLATGRQLAVLDSAADAKQVQVWSKPDYSHPWWHHTGQPADARIVQILPTTKTAQVIDTTTMKTTATRGNVGDGDDLYQTYGDRLYTAKNEGGYQVLSYDLAGMGEPAQLYRSPDANRRPVAMDACGSRVCVLDEPSSDGKQTQLVSIDGAGSTATWTHPAAGFRTVNALGDRAWLHDADSTAEAANVLYDEQGKKIAALTGQHLDPLTAGSALLLTGSWSDSTTSVSAAGVDIRTGARSELGLITVRPNGCAANEAYLVCPREKDFAIWRFAA